MRDIISPDDVRLRPEPQDSAATLEDSEYVDFSPTEEFRQVLDHLTSGAAAPA